MQVLARLAARLVQQRLQGRVGHGRMRRQRGVRRAMAVGTAIDIAQGQLMTSSATITGMLWAGSI